MPRRDDTTATFAPPRSLDEAETRRLDLVASIADIDAQLANRDRHDPATGQRLAAHAYWGWRNKALAAHRFKAEELRAVNAWMRQQRRQLHTRAPIGETVRALDLLRAVVAAVERGDHQQVQAAVQQARVVLNVE